MACEPIKSSQFEYNIIHFYVYEVIWAYIVTLKISLPSQVFVVPRAPTIIDYNSWNGSQVAAQYNFLNTVNVTFEEVLQIEASITLGALAALDWTQYMFHQANLIRTTEGNFYVCTHTPHMIIKCTCTHMIMYMYAS